MYGLALAVLAFMPTTACASLEITEFLAVNRDALEDDDGDHSDWIEVTNMGTESIDLDGWHLTDDATKLSRWTFPQLTLSGGNSILVFASNKDRTDPERPLHTNFKLNSSGEFLALVRPDGLSIESGFSPSYPRQFADVSYGIAGASEEEILISGSSGNLVGRGLRNHARLARLPVWKALKNTTHNYSGYSPRGGLLESPLKSKTRA